jgi:hypothetical protein
MLKVHTNHADHERIRHRAGEVVLVRHGHFVDAHGTTLRKTRPAVILETGNCSHMVAALTTRPRRVSTGTDRPQLPHPERMGLHPVGSFVMSHTPARIYRCDVVKHIGWVHAEAADVIAHAVTVHPLVACALHRVAMAEQIDGE